MKATLFTLKQIDGFEDCGSFVLRVKKKAEDFCVVGNLLHEGNPDDSDGDCAVCYSPFSTERQAVLVCNNEKVCRSCIWEQMGQDMKEPERTLRCLHCKKPYLPSTARRLLGRCCMFCLGNEDVASQFRDGPLDAFKKSCGHAFCKTCTKSYLIRCWQRENDPVMCPALGCHAIFNFDEQKKFVSDSISEEKCLSSNMKEMLSEFEDYCSKMLPSRRNPWIWTSPCCTHDGKLPLEAIVRSWCPSIPSALPTSGLSCGSCGTKWCVSSSSDLPNPTVTAQQLCAGALIGVASSITQECRVQKPRRCVQIGDCLYRRTRSCAVLRCKKALRHSCEISRKLKQATSISLMRT